jgi:hypothetical protein
VSTILSLRVLHSNATSHTKHLIRQKDKHHKQNTAFEQNPQKGKAAKNEQAEQERAAVRRPRTLNGASTKQKVIQKGGVSSIIPHVYSWREAGRLLVSDG